MSVSKTKVWDGRDTRHSLNLSPHCEDEQDEKVHDKDGPIHWDIEDHGESHEERDDCRASR